jgi:hypothetical protein
VPVEKQQMHTSLLPFLLFPFLLFLFVLQPVFSLFPEPELFDITWTDNGEASVTRSDEKSVLVDLWRSTNGVHWTNPWDLRKDPCISGWVGVLCNDNGNIISIDLPRNRLSGFLPRSLGMLTSLQKLHLNNNMLTGPLPKSLEKLTRLESLNLSQNFFTGGMPLGVTAFAKLILFHIASNDFNEQTMPNEFLQMEQRGVDVWVFENN